MPSELYVDFEKALHNPNIRIALESRPPSGPQACLEWFIFPIVAAYIAQSYFKALFGEMGKDHYLLLKEKLSETAGKVMSQPKIEPVLLGSAGKLNTKNPYSLAFSIYAEANDGKKFKLLLPKKLSVKNDYNEIVDIFLDFLAEYHAGIKQLDEIGFDSNVNPPSGFIFVRVDPITKSIEWLDHRRNG
ncbi:hypothetical protein [Pseudomonas syringae]|uniref:hypothetical protein n=1 Tax=Pseudomonas syringae TaxID=317 RepID=UPI001F0E1F8C|nr:hypothetical protein [Pseudomonas syringae]MCH5571745.1 hypothetical protein [Pseudomonas syringae pv. syringae]